MTYKIACELRCPRCGHRENAETTSECAELNAFINDPCPQCGRKNRVAHNPRIREPIRVWLLGDCEFVAARSLEEALDWYEGETGVDPVELDPEEYDLTATMLDDEPPQGKEVTFAEEIARMQSAGEPFPAIIAISGSCA